MSSSPRRRSIVVLVTASLVAVASAVLAAMGAYLHATDAARMRAELRSELRIEITQAAIGLSLPVRSADHPQVARVIEGVMANRNVAIAVVRQPDRSAPGGTSARAWTRDAAWHPVEASAPVAPAGLLEETRPVVANDREVATVTVYATPRFVEARLRARWITTVVQIAIVDLLLVIGLYLLLRWIVLRPLRAVEQLAHEVGHSEVSTTASGRVVRVRPRLYGELDRLHGALEKTFALLEERYAEVGRSETKYRLLAEQVADVIWVMAPDHQLSYMSPSSLALSGYTPEQLLAPGAALFTPPSLARVHAVIDGAHGPRPAGQVLELELVHADGHVVPVESSLLPMVDAAGQVIRLLGCTRDISERKRVERERAEREQQVQQSQKLEAVGTLASGIAHDFNNMLGVILASTESALELLPPEAPASEDLRRVVGAAERAATLVKQILSFSRQGQAQVRAIDLGTVVREALSMLRATLPNTVALRSRITDGVVVLADVTEVHQIVMNLCTNAWKAIGDQAGGTIEVAVECVALDAAAAAEHVGVTPGDHARLTITDDGAGMPPEVQARIFEPFFTTRADSGGTGLGLAMVHGIVTKASGAITVTSRVGHGSSFVIHLPAQAVPAAAVEAARRTQPGSERILIVDDEVALTDVFKRRLERLGYRVQVSNRPEDALAAVTAAPEVFDLVITDLTMRALPGDVLAAKLRALRADLPIILCTGSRERIPDDWSAQLGLAAVVSKPVSLAELTSVMKELLAAARGPDAPAAAGG